MDLFGPTSVKEGVGYNAFPPPAADIYLSPKKDLSWTGLPEFVDDTVTDYSRPSPTVASTSTKDQNKDSSTFENVASPNPPKPFIKFVKPKDNQPESPEFILNKKACYNCGDFSHLANNCRRRVQRETTRSQNHTYKRPPLRSSGHRPHGGSMRPSHRSSGHRPHGGPMRPSHRSAGHRPHGPLMNPRRPNMNGARPYKLFFNQAPSYETRPFFKSSAVRTQYRALWVPTINRNNPPVSRKFSTGRRNFPTVTRKFPTASRKFTTGSTKNHTVDIGRKGKAVNPSACWTWNPLQKLSNKGPINNSVSVMFKKYTYIDTQGRLKSNDETSDILKKFITEIENLKDLKVKIIRTLIEAARTMLADAKLPVTFWAEAVNTACYFQKRVLVNKSQNKTPTELFNGRTPAIGFLKPFGCHVMILNTLDNLGKFEAKGDEGYFIGYSMSSKAFRVFNKRTRRVKENLHVEFLENKAIEKGAGPNWLFDIDSLTKSMNYVPVDTESSTQVPEGSGNPNPTASSSNPSADQIETLTVESPIPTISLPVPTACLNDSSEPSSEARLVSKRVANQEETPSLDNILSLTNRFEDILGVSTSSDEIIRVEADVSNMETSISASPTPTLRILKDHPKSQIIGPVDTPIQTRHKSKMVEKQSFMATIHQKTDPALLQFYLFSCFLSQVEPKRKVWTLVDCPKGVRPIGTKWVLKNKKDERGIVVRNKARLVAQGHTQEEGIDYDEAPRAWYGTLSKYLLKNGFQRGTIDQTLFIRRQREDFILVQVCVDNIIFGSSNPQLCREFEALMHEKFQMSAMGELNFFLGLQVLQKEDGIFLSQDKYIGDILKKFGFSDVRSLNTPMDKENPWGKDGPGKDVELHLYRSMIGSLMYLTASRPDIMFAVCACARHQVTPKECHLHAVKRIFRYLKGNPKLGLWYPKASPFDLVAYLDSDYGGAS
nr:hypothetical protein [Tanacetum cinerariifolium]